MPKYYAYNIVYDFDDDDNEYGECDDLPTELEIYMDKDQDIEMEGADAISDIIGFCVESFNYKKLHD